MNSYFFGCLNIWFSFEMKVDDEIGTVMNNKQAGFCLFVYFCLVYSSVLLLILSLLVLSHLWKSINSLFLS